MIDTLFNIVSFIGILVMSYKSIEYITTHHNIDPWNNIDSNKDCEPLNILFKIFCVLYIGATTALVLKTFWVL